MLMEEMRKWGKKKTEAREKGVKGHSIKRKGVEDSAREIKIDSIQREEKPQTIKEEMGMEKRKM